MKIKNILLPMFLVFTLACKEESDNLLSEEFVGFINQTTETIYSVPNLGETERGSVIVQYGGPVRGEPINISWEIDAENTTAIEGTHYRMVTSGDLTINPSEFETAIEFDVILDGFATVAQSNEIDVARTLSFKITGGDLGVEPNLSSTTYVMSPLCPACVTVWSGPEIVFDYAGNGDVTLPENQDMITTTVSITRGEFGPIYNGILESEFNGPGDPFTEALSPVGTRWAMGSTSDGIENLTFDVFMGAVGGAGFGFSFVEEGGSTPMVLYLIEEDAYVDVTWLRWDSGGGGGFSYRRSTPQ